IPRIGSASLSNSLRSPSAVAPGETLSFNDPASPTMPNDQCDFGLIGLAVMGENLARNIESRGYSGAVFNRTASKVDEFLAGPAKGGKFKGCHSLEELVQSIQAPRKIMMMVKAGQAVDDLIEQ